MTKSPVLWGAGLACALGGAVAGTALGSTPVVDRPIIGTFTQAHDSASLSRGDGAAALPDHYPLITRHGTIPVEQLAERGLYSQTRFRGSDAGAEMAMEGPGAGYVAATPLALAAGPAVLNSVGGARSVEVSATLAMR